jgi:uncharacterized protein YodC (DUF2158 family)
MIEFEVGDVVRLPSGGPTMTVTQVFDDRREKSVGVQWFDDSDTLHAACFSPPALIKIPGPKN